MAVLSSDPLYLHPEGIVEDKSEVKVFNNIYGSDPAINKVTSFEDLKKDYVLFTPALLSHIFPELGRCFIDEWILSAPAAVGRKLEIYRSDPFCKRIVDTSQWSENTKDDYRVYCVLARDWNLFTTLISQIGVRHKEKGVGMFFFLHTCRVPDVASLEEVKFVDMNYIGVATEEFFYLLGGPIGHTPKILLQSATPESRSRARDILCGAVHIAEKQEREWKEMFHVR